jgi:hypothetical protein
MAARSGRSADGIGGLPVPGQKVGDASGRVVGDPGQDIGEIGLRIDAVELCRLDQRVHSSCASATGIGPGKEVILAANSNAAQGALGRIVVEAEAAVLEA